jgi:hypothetical protein
MGKASAPEVTSRPIRFALRCTLAHVLLMAE